MKRIVIKPGECAICSKKVGKDNCTTYRGFTVHVGCLHRLVPR